MWHSAPGQRQELDEAGDRPASSGSLLQQRLRIFNQHFAPLQCRGAHHSYEPFQHGRALDTNLFHSEAATSSVKRKSPTSVALPVAAEKQPRVQSSASSAQACRPPLRDIKLPMPFAPITIPLVSAQVPTTALYQSPCSFSSASLTREEMAIFADFGIDAHAGSSESASPWPVSTQHSLGAISHAESERGASSESPRVAEAFTAVESTRCIETTSARSVDTTLMLKFAEPQLRASLATAFTDSTCSSSSRAMLPMDENRFRDFSFSGQNVTIIGSCSPRTMYDYNGFLNCSRYCFSLSFILAICTFIYCCHCNSVSLQAMGARISDHAPIILIEPPHAADVADLLVKHVMHARDTVDVFHMSLVDEMDAAEFDRAANRQKIANANLLWSTRMLSQT